MWGLPPVIVSGRAAREKIGRCVATVQRSLVRTLSQLGVGNAKDSSTSLTTEVQRLRQLEEEREQLLLFKQQEREFLERAAERAKLEGAILAEEYQASQPVNAVELWQKLDIQHPQSYDDFF